MFFTIRTAVFVPPVDLTCKSYYAPESAIYKKHFMVIPLLPGLFFYGHSMESL